MKMLSGKQGKVISLAHHTGVHNSLMKVLINYFILKQHYQVRTGISKIPHAVQHIPLDLGPNRVVKQFGF